MGSRKIALESPNSRSYQPPHFAISTSLIFATSSSQLGRLLQASSNASSRGSCCLNQMEKLVPLRVMRSKTGCFQCRRRKKKCDETYPTCSGCRWNALTCQWPDPDAPSKGRRKHQHRSSDCHAANTASPFLLAHSEGPSLSYIQWPATEPHANRFFFHFIHVTSKMLSVNSKGRRTHFIQHVSTAAMSNPLVMNCVLALGAAHLSACEGKNKSFKDKGRQHYGAAISQLQENIKDTVDTPNLQQAQPVSATNNSRGLQNDGTLLAVMLLCFYEVSSYCGQQMESSVTYEKLRI